LTVNRPALALALALAGGCRGLLSIEEKQLATDTSGLDGAIGDGPAVGDGGGDGGNGGCPVGQSPCPTGCKDLQYDAENCGVCGRVCPNECDTGRCTGKKVTFGNIVDVADMTSNADTIFYTNKVPPIIRRVKKSGMGGVQMFANSGPTPTGIALRDDAFVYWATTNSDPSIVRRAQDAGGSNTAIVSGSLNIGALVLDATTVWFTRSVDGEVGYAPIEGGAASVLVSGVASPGRITQDAVNVYYIADELPDVGVWAADKAGTGKTQLHSGKVLGLAYRGGHLYTSASGTGAILRIATDGGPTVPLVPSGETTVRALDVDDTFVYWASADGTISRTKLSPGSPVERIAVAAVDPTVILASDPVAVYWYAPNGIFTTPK
jgi:hypothetical protein